MGDIEQIVQVELVAGESAIADLERQLVEDGGILEAQTAPFDPPVDELDDYADPQFEPLLVLCASVSAAFLLRTLSNIWLDHVRPGGLIVDARTEKLSLRPAPHLSRNTLIVLSPSGEQRFAPESGNEALEAVRTLITSLTGNRGG